MEQIMNCIVDIAGLLVGAFIAYLAKVYISEQKLERFINSLVRAAEQMYDKDIDDEGKIRLAYVEAMLIDAGYELTAAIKAMIESKVFDLNSEQKKNQLRG